MPVRSLPIAETARCCFIGSMGRYVPRWYGRSVPGERCAGDGCSTWLRPRRNAPYTCRLTRRVRLSSRSSMFSGSLVAIVTPMRVDGSIDFSAWDRLIDWHIESGTTGLVVGGTTGESATLTDPELWELAQRACERARHRIAV